jgi:hypothetical protein
MNYAQPWYVAVGETTAGPASTDLVIKGIEHRKVPPEAMVCAVGAARWVPLSSVEAFHAAVVRSYPPPPDSEEARQWLAHGFHFPRPAALPQFDDDAGTEPGVSAHADEDPATLRDPSLSEIEVELSPDPPAVAWREPFASYFLVGDDVVLPEEDALVESLAATERETFHHEEALWNLALCLAYGSDEVGAAAARAFFEAVGDQDGGERIAWMMRALRGDGFIPSGIPMAAGEVAFERLRSSCPPALTGKLSS